MHIIKASYLISSPSYKNCPKSNFPEYAFIGRSNVGKSSLINMITGQTSLAKTSATPGKTQLINHFTIESKSAQKSKEKSVFWYLVDLPGYGYAKRSQKEREQWEKMIEEYFAQRPNLTNVFVLIDGRHAPMKIDIEFVSNLDKWQVPFTLVFTKADKEKPTVVQRNMQAFLDELKKTWQFLPQSIITSATKKQGREELLNLITQKNEMAYTS